MTLPELERHFQKLASQANRRARNNTRFTSQYTAIGAARAYRNALECVRLLRAAMKERSRASTLSQTR